MEKTGRHVRNTTRLAGKRTGARTSRKPSSNLSLETTPALRQGSDAPQLRSQELVKPGERLSPRVAGRRCIVCRSRVVVKSMAHALIDVEAERLLLTDHGRDYCRRLQR